MRALIGKSGLIGRYLQQQQQFDAVIGQHDITKIEKSFDTVVIAAPSGNRLAVRDDPARDLEAVTAIMKFVAANCAGKVILISTVDTIHAPHTAYGHNRLILENFVRTLPQHHVIRLCSIIHESITKNVLHDLAHGRWLDSIRPDQQLQWYPLCDLSDHMRYVEQHHIRDINLVSEPIKVRDIQKKFFPHTQISSLAADIGYDVHCHSPDLCQHGSPYVYTKQHIFDHMQHYVQNQHRQQ